MAEQRLKQGALLFGARGPLAPDALGAFRALVDTGCVELLGETSHHSLAFLFDAEEHDAQVARHREQLQAVFGVRATTFRGTELARAQCGTIRLKLLKIGALVSISVRQVRFRMASGYPHQELFWDVLSNLQSGLGPP